MNSCINIKVQPTCLSKNFSDVDDPTKRISALVCLRLPHKPFNFRLACQKTLVKDLYNLHALRVETSERSSRSHEPIDRIVGDLGASENL